MFPASTQRRRIPLLLLAAVFGLTVGCGEGSGQSQEAQTPPENDEIVDLSEMGFNEGDPETAVMGIVEFSDFGCVYCAGFHIDTYPSLYEEFVDAGDVLWKYIPITIGGFPNGDLAGIAGQCAGQLGEFAPLRDRLYDRREEWMAADEGAELFVGYAETVGLDGEEFAACMESDDVRATIDENNRVARMLGVSGTPTFIVQGQAVQGAPPLDAFQEALRESVSALREAEQG